MHWVLLRSTITNWRDRVTYKHADQDARGCLSTGHVGEGQLKDENIHNSNQLFRECEEILLEHCSLNRVEFS